MSGLSAIKSFMDTVRSTFPRETPEQKRRKLKEEQVRRELLGMGISPDSRVYRRLHKKMMSSKG